MLSGGVDACAIWSPQSLTILDEMEGAHQAGPEHRLLRHQHLPGQLDRSCPSYLEAHHDVAVRFMRALLPRHGLRRPGGEL